METKEFEKLKVVFVPKLGIIGLVGSNKGPDITIYSTEIDSDGNNLLVINVMLCGSSLDGTYEVTRKAKGRLLDEILNSNFKVGSFRVIRDGETVFKESLTDIEAGFHLCNIRYQINRIYKNKNKNMETEKIFIPFYLEYVGTYLINWLCGTEGIVFKKVDGSYAFVYGTGKSRSIRCREFEDDGMFTKSTNNDSLVREVGKVIMSGDFSELDFKLFDGLNGKNQSISESEKDQYLLAILNCLDMNFSHKSMINDEVTNNWGDLRQFDTLRSEYFDSRSSDQLFELPKTIWVGMINTRLSNKVYEHFKNYSMKKKIDVSKITCIRDVEDGIDFIKLDVKNRCYGGDFDLVGVEDRFDGGYNLIIREVSEKDLYLCRYRTLSGVEKEFVYDLIDRIQNVKEVVEQVNSDDLEYTSDDVDDYSDYIEYVTDHILRSREGSSQNDEGEYVDNILNTLDRIRDNVSGESRELIKSDNYKPIMDYLSYVDRYLAVLKENK